jgi:hypothetical protein
MALAGAAWFDTEFADGGIDAALLMLGTSFPAIRKDCRRNLRRQPCPLLRVLLRQPHPLGNVLGSLQRSQLCTMKRRRPYTLVA